MKAVFGIFILCLVVANASTVKKPRVYQEVESKNLLILTEKTLRGIDDVSKDMKSLSGLPAHQRGLEFLIQRNASNLEDPINYINSIINEGKELSVRAFNQLELNYQIDSEVSLQEVDNVLYSIENRKSQAIGVKCAIDETLSVTSVVKALFTDIKKCTVNVVKEPLKILKDIKDATFQIIFDGFELLELRNECKSKSGLGSLKCYAEIGGKLVSYSKKSLSSIRTLVGTFDRMTAIIPNAVGCSNLAKDNAVTELKEILDNINVCLGNK